MQMSRVAVGMSDHEDPSSTHRSGHGFSARKRGVLTVGREALHVSGGIWRPRRDYFRSKLRVAQSTRRAGPAPRPRETGAAAPY